MYSTVDTIDPIVGALAEDHLPSASLGPLSASVFREQFRRSWDGDRFYFEHDPDLTDEERSMLRQTRLSEVILQNTGITNLQPNVFLAVPEPPGVQLVLGVIVAMGGLAWVSRIRLAAPIRVARP